VCFFVYSCIQIIYSPVFVYSWIKIIYSCVAFFVYSCIKIIYSCVGFFVYSCTKIIYSPIFCVYSCIKIIYSRVLFVHSCIKIIYSFVFLCIPYGPFSFLVLISVCILWIKWYLNYLTRLYLWLEHCLLKFFVPWESFWHSKIVWSLAYCRSVI
jgi:glycosyltransferase involved in cell wall biosynthesis